MSEHEFIRILFDGPPSHESGRFIEVETEYGNSISFGEWIEGEDGLWYLQFPNPTNEHAALKRIYRRIQEADHPTLTLPVEMTVAMAEMTALLAKDTDG